MPADTYGARRFAKYSNTRRIAAKGRDVAKRETKRKLLVLVAIVPCGPRLTEKRLKDPKYHG
jgi:hypothetical protein